MIAIAGLTAGCGSRPPPPPRTQEVPRVPAEESCASSTEMPRLPAAPPADPYRLTHSEAMVAALPGPTPVNFLCDLPDRVLAIAATQTVDGGRRVVGGGIIEMPRPGSSDALRTVEIAPSSRGCLQGELACSFDAADKTLGAIDMLREQRVHTGGWVHGREDLCRALPDDTIAVCSTVNRMAYVELGCDGRLALGLHDASLPRVFDLDVEAPTARLHGALDPTSGGARWRFDFARDQGATGPAAKGPAKASLTIDLTQQAAELIIDGETERCWVFSIARR